MRATTSPIRLAALWGSALRGRGRRGDTASRYLRGPETGKRSSARFLSWLRRPETRRRPRYHAAMVLEPIATAEAPRAIGPYSQAVAARGQRLVFCSGQIPIDPRTGELVGAGDVEAETHRVMRNLGAVLVAAGTSFEAVVKTTIYLTDL